MTRTDTTSVPGTVSRRAVICALVALCAFAALALSISSTTAALSDDDGHVWSIDGDVVRFRKTHDVWFDSSRRVRVLELRDIAPPPQWVVLGLAGLAASLARRRWAVVGGFGAALGILPIVEFVIKPLVHRTVHESSEAAVFAFPSLSVATVASVAAAFVLSFAGRWRIAAALLASLSTAMYTALVALSGSHFLTDCIGSILLGPPAVILGARAGLLAQDYSRRRKPPRQQTSSP